MGSSTMPFLVPATLSVSSSIFSLILSKSVYLVLGSTEKIP